MKLSKLFTLVVIFGIGFSSLFAINQARSDTSSNVFELDKVVSKDKLLKDLDKRIEKIDSIYESINSGVKKDVLCKKINELYFKRDSLWALFEYTEAHPESKIKISDSTVLSANEIKKKTTAALPSNGINFCGGGIAELNPELVGNKTYLAKVLNTSRKGNLTLQEMISEREPASSTDS
jgi:hypothetical protein